MPEKIVYLFEYDGENVPDCMHHNSLWIDMYTFNIESEQKTIRKTAGFLRENISEQEIIDIFNKCGYDDQYILEIYRYSGKD